MLVDVGFPILIRRLLIQGLILNLSIHDGSSQNDHCRPGAGFFCALANDGAINDLGSHQSEFVRPQHYPDKLNSHLCYKLCHAQIGQEGPGILNHNI